MPKIKYNRQPVDLTKPFVNKKSKQMKDGKNRLTMKVEMLPKDKKYLQVLAKNKGVSGSKFANDILTKELRRILKRETEKNMKRRF